MCISRIWDTEQYGKRILFQLPPVVLCIMPLLVCHLYLSSSLLTYSQLEIVSPDGCILVLKWISGLWDASCTLSPLDDSPSWVCILFLLPFQTFTKDFISPLGHSANATRELIMKGTFSVPYHISGDLKSLICSMLNVDPTKRFTIDQVVCILSSPQKGKKILLCFV